MKQLTLARDFRIGPVCALFQQPSVITPGGLLGKARREAAKAIANGGKIEVLMPAGGTHGVAMQHCAALLACWIYQVETFSLPLLICSRVVPLPEKSGHNQALLRS